MIKESAPPPPSLSGVVGGVPGGVPGGVLGGVIGSVVNSASTAQFPKLAAQPQRIRISQGVSEGLLIHKVKPLYPEIAREARVQGPVVLRAVITKDGIVQQLQLVYGNPMLVASAIDAVKEWRFRPYRLDGQPVEIETTITINFHLG
jgi:protein TonB